MSELLTLAALQPAPSPLEGEGWGGGYDANSAFVISPPSRPPSRYALRRSTSPSRGEVTSECISRGHSSPARGEGKREATP